MHLEQFILQCGFPRSGTWLRGFNLELLEEDFPGQDNPFVCSPLDARPSTASPGRIVLGPSSIFLFLDHATMVPLTSYSPA